MLKAHNLINTLVAMANRILCFHGNQFFYKVQHDVAYYHAQYQIDPAIISYPNYS